MQRRWPTCPGITPRWAGCHPHAYRITISRTTHPRACGENVAAASTWGGNAGSSPRGRGKRNQPRRAHPAGRLIPARAGKTSHGPDHRLASTAHPRAGGENQDENIVNLSKQGSSPRGRGKPRLITEREARARLIPARAGKTTARVEARSGSAAHPRAGGENSGVGSLREVDEGSSPRGRGKPFPGVAAPATRRLIPARAGKTQSSHLRPSSRRAHPRAGGENTF